MLELEEKRQLLVKRMNGLILHDPKSYRQLSQEIGINVITFNNFMKSRRLASMKTLALIQRYIDKCVDHYMEETQ